jgi:hypothetical protein
VIHALGINGKSGENGVICADSDNRTNSMARCPWKSSEWKAGADLALGGICARCTKREADTNAAISTSACFLQHPLNGDDARFGSCNGGEDQIMFHSNDLLKLPPFLPLRGDISVLAFRGDSAIKSHP